MNGINNKSNIGVSCLWCVVVVVLIMVLVPVLVCCPLICTLVGANLNLEILDWCFLVALYSILEENRR